MKKKLILLLLICLSFIFCLVPVKNASAYVNSDIPTSVSGSTNPMTYIYYANGGTLSYTNSSGTFNSTTSSFSQNFLNVHYSYNSANGKNLLNNFPIGIFYNQTGSSSYNLNKLSGSRDFIINGTNFPSKLIAWDVYDSNKNFVARVPHLSTITLDDNIFVSAYTSIHFYAVYDLPDDATIYFQNDVVASLDLFKDYYPYDLSFGKERFSNYMRDFWLDTYEYDEYFGSWFLLEDDESSLYEFYCQQPDYVKASVQMLIKYLKYELTLIGKEDGFSSGYNSALDTLNNRNNPYFDFNNIDYITISMGLSSSPSASASYSKYDFYVYDSSDGFGSKNFKADKDIDLSPLLSNLISFRRSETTLDTFLKPYGSFTYDSIATLKYHYGGSVSGTTSTSIKIYFKEKFSAFNYSYTFDNNTYKTAVLSSVDNDDVTFSTYDGSVSSLEYNRYGFPNTTWEDTYNGADINYLELKFSQYNVAQSGFYANATFSSYLIANTYELGFDAGYNQGYGAGHVAGYDEGHIAGKDFGYNNGYLEGKEFGFNTGYNQGYTEGYSIKDMNFTNLIWTIGALPFESFKTIWDVEFLGINISNFVTGLLMALAAIFIIKRVF